MKKFDFASVKTASTPIETQKPLVKDEEASDVDVHLYRSMIGSLMYLTASRPDIMFAVCACSRFQVTPKTSHLNAVKRIFGYLKGKPKLGLWYHKVSSFDLEAYSDSDYAGANLDRKSTIGGCQFLGRRLISWQCKKQTIVATSTTEAEYVAAANCCGQVLWIQNQMLDYGFNFMNTKIYIDNESTICIVKNPVFHSKTKHIAIRHHFIRDAYEKKLIQVLKIHTNDNVADLLTKAFDVSRFQFLVKRKGGHMKMIARKRKRPQPDVDSDDEHRKCLKIVTLKQYSESTPEGIKLILWGELKIMTESSIEVTNQGNFWNDQQDWEIVTWRLYKACGFCILEFKDGTVIHMLVERKYPLSKELLQRMLDFGLEVEVESTAALDLIRRIAKDVKETLRSDQDLSECLNTSSMKFKESTPKKHEVKQVQQSCLGEDCWELYIPDLVPCFSCGNPVDDQPCRYCTCERCGYYNRGFPIIHQPPQETNTEILQARENLMEAIQAFSKKYDHIPPREKCMALWLAEERFLKVKQALEEGQNQPENCPIFDDDDDNDEESSIPLKDIISELPLSNAITPDFSITDSIIMEDEHLDTIPETESDEENESSVEDLNLTSSEFEDLSDIESECDMSVCDDFMTFSNPLFDSNDDFTSSDDELLSDEDVPEENFKIYSSPLFDEEIISTKIDPHHFNAESDLIESLLNRDTLIVFSPKFDSLLEEFSDELTHIDLISLEIDEADFDPEEEIRLVKKLLYDNSSPRPPEELNYENSDVVIESFSPSPIPVEDSDSLMEEIDIFLAPDDSIPPSIENDDYDSEGDCRNPINTSLYRIKHELELERRKKELF
ncbi:hypothetical protein Tco_0581073 [Tanacetum coccineum]